MSSTKFSQIHKSTYVAFPDNFVTFIIQICFHQTELMHISDTIIINSILVCIYLTFSGYWALVFIRIIHCSRKYKKGAARCIIDEELEFVNEQICYHHETEIWKYVYLLGINFFEISSTLLTTIAHVIVSYIEDIKEYNTTFPLFKVSECNINATMSENESILLKLSLYNFLDAIGRSAELIWIVISMCLMNYLIIRIKKMKSCHNTRNSFHLLLITTWLCLFIFFTNMIQTLRLVSYFTFEIVAIVYVCMFMRTCNNLKRALLQRALERLIQHGSNNIEMREYRYFKYTINIICWFILCICIGQSLIYIPRYAMGVLINQGYYFPFNMLQYFYYFKGSDELIRISTKLMYYMDIIGTVFVYIGLIFARIPFVLITSGIWIRYLLKYIQSTPKTKYSTVDSLVLQCWLNNQKKR